MKSISAALDAHLAGTLTTTALLIKITRRDGAILGFTTTDHDLIVDGIPYIANGALTPSAIQGTSAMSIDNLDIAGMIDSDHVKENDIKAGNYDHAEVEVMLCNWADLTQGVITLRRGWIGQITRTDTHYAAELRGLHDLLQRPIGATYTAECRHALGDSGCGINLATYTTTGSVTSAIDRVSFVDTARAEADDTFNYGVLTWVTGDNSGTSVEVKDWQQSTKQFSLWLPTPNTIQIGDQYSLYRGCDKRITTCKNVFANVTNFGGFPYIPGVGNILKYPDSK